MGIRYYVSADPTRLYDSTLLLHSRSRTFGQHSYILDFAAAASRMGLDVRFSVQGLETFPIVPALKEYSLVTPLRGSGEADEAIGTADAVILDNPTEVIARGLPPEVLVATIVHNAGEVLSNQVVGRTSFVVCMTPNAMRLQADRVPPEKLVLVPQGVDLVRFRPSRTPKVLGAAPRILWYTRFSPGKRTVIASGIEAVLATGWSLTLLGDGPCFWEFSDRYSSDITLVNFVPCHSMQNFLPWFDVIISSGRGVMEALACGVPAICAGFGYGGLVHEGSITKLLEYNLTGWRLPSDFGNLRDDIECALAMSAANCREIAMKYLDVSSTVVHLATLLGQDFPQDNTS